MKHLLPALEMIDFQNDHPLGKSIEEALLKLRLSPTDTITREQLAESGLAQTIKRHTGLSVSIVVNFNYTYNACMIMPILDRNHTLTVPTKRYKGGTLDLGGVGEGVKPAAGGIDRKKVMVYGAFAKMPAILELAGNYVARFSQVPVEEVTAVILHELGHLFTYMELIGRTLTTNHLLDEAQQRLLGTIDDVTKYKLIKECDLNTLPKETMDALVKAKDAREITMVIIAEAINNSHSELGANIYDERACEQLADQFMIRMGYGRQYARLTQRTIPMYYGFRDRPVSLMTSTLRFLLSVVMVPFIPYVIMFPKALGHRYDRPGGLSYDNTKRRTEVILNEMQASLKESIYSKEDKERILNDIDAIKKVIDGIHEDNYAIFKWIRDIYYARGQRTIDIQRALEDLAKTKLNESLTRLELLEN